MFATNHHNNLKMKISVICVMLVLSMFTNAVEAKKQSSGSRRGGSSSKGGGVSSGRVSKPSQTQTNSNSHADLAKLSYSGYNQQPNAPKTHQAAAAPPAPPPLPKASAPVDASGQNKPVGWNVDNANKQNVPHQNAAPYPVNNQQHPAAPPPYSPVANQGPPPAYNPVAGQPPAYSQYPQHNGNPQFNQAPPPYSAGNQGFQPGVAPGYQQQPHYGGAPAQNYPGGQQPGGYPVGGNGYPVQAGGYPQGAPGGFGGQPQVNNYYPQQQSSGGIGLGGLNTALIAGVGGIALYGALKPHEQKTIIIYHSDNTTSVVPANGTDTVTLAPGLVAGNETTTITPLAPFPEAQVPLAPMPTTEAVANNDTMTVNISLAENITITNSTMPLATEVPLATFPPSVAAPQTIEPQSTVTSAAVSETTGTGVASALNSSSNDVSAKSATTATMSEGSGSEKLTSSVLLVLIPVVCNYFVRF
jgi:hypothetical protein